MGEPAELTPPGNPPGACLAAELDQGRESGQRNLLAADDDVILALSNMDTVDDHVGLGPVQPRVAERRSVCGTGESTARCVPPRQEGNVLGVDGLDELPHVLDGVGDDDAHGHLHRPRNRYGFGFRIEVRRNPVR